MDRIHDFLGLDKKQYNLNSEELEAILDETYPQFEESSGWSMQGDYSFVICNSAAYTPALTRVLTCALLSCLHPSAMTPELRQKLAKFFQEPVRELDKVLCS